MQHFVNIIFIKKNPNNIYYDFAAQYYIELIDITFLKQIYSSNKHHI